MTGTFKAGDRVRFRSKTEMGERRYTHLSEVLCTKEDVKYPNNLPTGTIIQYIDASTIGVEWDIRFSEGHNLGGKCKHGHGFWVYGRELTLLESDPAPCVLSGVMLEWDNPDRVTIDEKVYSKKALEALL